MNETIKRALGLSPAEIDHLFGSDGVSAEELQELEREAGALAQKAAWLAEYIGHRGAHGYGDHGHAMAEYEANKYLKKVRKAMGYTYP